MEYSGAIYHVMNRGDRREPIFRHGNNTRLTPPIVKAKPKARWLPKPATRWFPQAETFISRKVVALLTCPVLRLRPRFGRSFARRQLGWFEHAALIVRVFNPLFQSFAQPFERGLMLRHV